MPIPSDYQDIIALLIKGTSEGRVNWTEKGGAYIVRLPEFILEMWSGTNEERGKQFIAIGLKDPKVRGYVHSWDLEEGDPDFELLQGFFDQVRQQTNKVPQKLQTLRKLLQSNQKIGLDLENDF